MSKPIEFDKWGRMKFHPDYHAKNGKPWSREDIDYLIDQYEAIGPEECSMALERTIRTVMNKASVLRKLGVMPYPTVKKAHKRTMYREWLKEQANAS